MPDPTEAASTPAVSPPVPAQLWALWQDLPGHEHGGYYIVSLDDAPHGETYLVAFTETEAVMAANYQNESYDLNCRPVRIK